MNSFLICRFTSNTFDNGLGFKLEYESTNIIPQWTFRIGACGGRFTTPNGILTSPSYPDIYPDNADCIYTITQSNGAYVNISSLTMDVDCQEMERTPSDYIEMRDGSSQDSPLMGLFCGNGSNVPDFMQTTQNHLRIR